MTENAPAPAAEEPSIEEILASIRKIISDEPGAEDGTPATPEAAAEPPVEAFHIEEDVLDLSAFTAPAAPDMDLDLTDGSSPDDVFDPFPKHLAAAESRDADIGIASTQTLDAAAAAMAKLQRASEPSYPSTTQLWVGARTIEQLVEDLLRPILKTWLDQNLPKLVERLVEKELARMSKRVGE
jgi:cell pole-organizing protein PopZ